MCVQLRLCCGSATCWAFSWRDYVLVPFYACLFYIPHVLCSQAFYTHTHTHTFPLIPLLILLSEFWDLSLWLLLESQLVASAESQGPFSQPCVCGLGCSLMQGYLLTCWAPQGPRTTLLGSSQALVTCHIFQPHWDADHPKGGHELSDSGSLLMAHVFPRPRILSGELAVIF